MIDKFSPSTKNKKDFEFAAWKQLWQWKSRRKISTVPYQ